MSASRGGSKQSQPSEGRRPAGWRRVPATSGHGWSKATRRPLLGCDLVTTSLPVVLIDAEAVASAPNLKVVARAGIGLDNVGVAAATERGVMVVNAPTSNIVSAAGHAVALLLAAARQIPAADATLRQGQWKRSKFMGVELTDKTVGAVGLGRIGILVAQRLAAFGVTLIAYDPYTQPGRAAQLGVRMVPLDELLRESDFITIHLPKTPETVGLIGAEELATTKRGVIIVNAARGGLIDEQALADALKSGAVAAAGLDVYATEPCTDSPLFGLPNTVVTPHLGASTTEAQDKAGTAVARSVRLALQGEFVPDAVNVQAGGVVAEDVRPGLPLAEKLGRVFTAVAGGLAQSVNVEVRGKIAEFDVSVVQLAVLKGVFSDVVQGLVTYVNAPLLAEQRGLEVALSSDEESPDYRNLITVRGAMAEGTPVTVSGTLFGKNQVPKLTEVDGFDIDLDLSGYLLFFTYTDRPGVVGTVGAALGEAGINIAGAQVSRTTRGGEALMAVTVDSPVSTELLEDIAGRIGAREAHSADLNPL